MVFRAHLFVVLPGVVVLSGCPLTPDRLGVAPQPVLHQEGGDLVNALCAPDEYLVGVTAEARPNEWITKLRVSCARWSQSTFVGTATAPAIGPGGGGVFSGGGCERGGAVQNAVITIHAPGGNLRRFDIVCWDQFGLANADFTLGFTAPPVGLTLGVSQCPITHRAFGIQARVSADAVDGVGLVCAPIPSP